MHSWSAAHSAVQRGVPLAAPPPSPVEEELVDVLAPPSPVEDVVVVATSPVEVEDAPT